MTKKKVAKPKTPATPSFSRTEGFYIEQHYGRKDAAAIAAEIERTEADVQYYLDQLKASGVEPVEKKKNAIEKAGYGIKNGVVVATPTSSMIADEREGTNPLLPSYGTPKTKKAPHQNSRYKPADIQRFEP